MTVTDSGCLRAHGSKVAPDADITARLSRVGGKFRFAILADPLIAHPDSHDRVPLNANLDLFGSPAGTTPRSTTTCTIAAPVVTTVST